MGPTTSGIPILGSRGPGTQHELFRKAAPGDVLWEHGAGSTASPSPRQLPRSEGGRDSARPAGSRAVPCDLGRVTEVLGAPAPSSMTEVPPALVSPDCHSRTPQQPSVGNKRPLLSHGLWRLRVRVRGAARSLSARALFPGGRPMAACSPRLPMAASCRCLMSLLTGRLIHLPFPSPHP